jgi:phosphoribosylanthranilate isomerase
MKVEPRLFVKICGVRTPEEAVAAAKAGADAVGLVFWLGSPRRVDAPVARAIARALPPAVLRVGVFVDAEREELARTADEAELDLLQLHGEEPPERFCGLPRRAWKALRVGPGFAPAEADRYAGRAAGLVLDARVEGAPGGTGHAFDWSLARGVRDRCGFLVLAGGLTPETVAEAIRAVRPHGVDVSSGVESAPGRKDPAKVRAFVEAARSAR